MADDTAGDAAGHAAGGRAGEPDWEAIDAALEADELERIRAARRRHGTVGTAVGRVGMGLSEIYEGKPAREVEEAMAEGESGQGHDGEDPADVVIRVDPP